MMCSVRLVDAVLVRKLKQKTVKDIHQNFTDTQIRGQAVKEALEYLGLWADDDPKLHQEGNDEKENCD